MTLAANGFPATPLTEHLAAITRILTGNSSYYNLCSLQITLCFSLLSTFSSQYWRTIAIILMPLEYQTII